MACARTHHAGLVAPRASGRWTTVFTKLAIFGLGNTTAGKVDKVAFVDLDAFITNDQADTIFDSCAASEVRCSEPRASTLDRASMQN